MLGTWLHDVRYALRLLAKSPLFAATATLSLAIGIGANTTIFSIASALLLRTLPGLAESERLVDIGRTQGGSGFDTVSFPNYRDLRERTRTLQGIYAYRVEPQPMSLGGPAEAERIYGMLVTANYFSVLGTTPALGRLLRDEDDGNAAGQAVVVISHDLWQRRFSADPQIAGRSITLNGHPFTVVGVAPRGFQGTSILKPDAWTPMSALTQASPRMSANMFKNRQAVWLAMGGRLASGVTGGQAEAEVRAIGANLQHPVENEGKGFTLAPIGVMPGQVPLIAGFMGVLMAIVGLVLLIACVNVAGMLLARAAARRREIAVRLAVGAGRARLVRQLLTETAVLFAVGGGAGLLLTRWLTALLLSLIPALPVPVAIDLALDWRVVAFTIGLSAVAAVLAGLAPALQASRFNLVPALRAEGLDGGPSRLRLRNAFVVGQVVMSLVLVIAAGLLLRSLQRAADVDPGFDQRNVDVVSLDLSLAGYTEATARPFVTELTRPGIADADQLPRANSQRPNSIARSLAASVSRGSLAFRRLGFAPAACKASEASVHRRLGVGSWSLVLDTISPVLHVLNGDATRVKLERAGLPGAFCVWADALHEGPVPADAGPSELRELRVRHFAALLGAPIDELRAMVWRWDADLDRFAEHEEVVFWFEHDLFDQLILIRHLHWLSTLDRGSARFSLICIGSFPGVSRFTGLGALAADHLATLYPARQPVSDAQVSLGRDAWSRFREPAPQRFARQLGEDTAALPFLAGAIRRHLEDFPSASSGLSRSERQMLGAVATGCTRFVEIFKTCQQQEERVYMGDTTFRSILLALTRARHPLLAIGSDGDFTLTRTGRDVLAGRADHVALNGIDRWMGGVHLTPDTLWRAEELLAR